jgi:hypothetical protein
MAFTITCDGNLDCLDLDFTGAVGATIDLAAATVTIAGNFTAIADLTVTPGTSLIKMTGNTKNFDGAGKEYNNIEFTGTPITVISGDIFNDMKLTAGKTVVFTAGTTQTITTLSGDGTLGNEIVIESSSAGTHYHFVCSNTIVTRSYWSIKDSYAGGGAVFTALNSIDVSGNNGWNFGDANKKYWVGHTGIWFNTSNWSYISGGGAGASIPCADDSVYFDANSFSAEDQIMTLDAATAACKDMDWTGATNTPSYTSNGFSLDVYGSITLIPDMTIDGTTPGVFVMKSTSTGKTITTAGKSIDTLTINGVGGEWTLLDSLTVSNTLSLVAGNLITSNGNVTVLDFMTDGILARGIDIGDYTLDCSGNWTIVSSTNLIFSVGVAQIKMTGDAKVFDGGGLIYYNIEFVGTPITVSGDNIFNDMKMTAGKTVIFTAGTTQTITTWSGDGTTGNLITITSTAGGEQYFIICGSGTIDKNYYSIKDSNVGGGATFIGTNCTFVSNNTGWTIISIASIVQHTGLLEILEYIGDDFAEEYSDEDYLLMTGHGLVTGDFIVNKTIRDAAGMGSAERGSRKVTRLSDDILEYSSEMVGQAESDEIYLFKWVDITQYLLDRTLKISLKSNHSNTAGFKLFLPIVADAIPFLPQPGQYIRITLDDMVRFTGIISDADPIEGQNEIHPYIYQQISCVGLKNIAARRTVAVDYAANYYIGDIVADINDMYLCQDGLNKSAPEFIDEGIELGEAWKNDCIAMSDIFDECASKCGYQWFIDADMQLHFYQDPAVIVDAPDLDINSRFRGLKLKRSIDGYVNKNFVIGGKDYDGQIIKTLNMNLTQQNAMQMVCGGSGIYSNIIRDSAITSVLVRTAEAGTAFFTIAITDHGMVVGDYVYNATLGHAFWVTSVIGDDSFMVNETIYDQAENDVIVTHPMCDKASLNILKRQGFLPTTVEYTIDQINIYPQTKQKITLPRLGIDANYFNIESVSISAVGAGYYESLVTAILRDNTNFSTQPHPAFTEYMRGF